MRLKFLFLFILILMGRLNSQTLHHQSIGAQSFNSKSKNIKVLQSVGQIQVIGNKKNDQLIVFEGFQQSLNEFIEIDNISISLYPNPTSDIVYLSFDQHIKIPFKVEVCDVIGKIISFIDFEPSDKNIYSMSIKEMASSVYLIKVNVGHKKFYSKIIKK